MRGTLVVAAWLLAGCGAGTDARRTDAPDAGDGPAPDCAAPTDPPAGAVRTATGLVRGAVGDGVTAFKGIPYAAPPLGDLRWRPPQPAACWDGVREATSFGYSCMQTTTTGDPSTTPVGSEDCLTLNVWTPEPRDDAARPVLVFVHGGYFTWGSSSRRFDGVDIYDGAHLAAAGAVVVTINYRLGALGFIGHPGLGAENDLGASGNYGLLDQIAALEWVQTNIAAFGGDPARVMLFGQSAGAISTAALYASPLARGLFAAAILHSGAADHGHTLADSERAGLELGARVGCADDDATTAIACLRAHGATEIVAALPESLDGGYAFGPTVDGRVLPDRPLALVRNGQGSRVPLIVGVTANEFTTMIQNYVTAPITSADAYAAFLRGRLGDARAAAILERYPASAYPSPMAALVDFFGDVIFVCPSRRFARAAALHAPVRRFVYTHTYAAEPFAHLRAGHGLDLPFVLGNFFSYTPTADERDLERTVRHAWLAFAAGGDPAPDGALAWPAYDPVADTYLVLDTPISAGSAFHGDRCDFFDAGW
jgi:para-nitrobenzyl esterase